MYEQMTPCSKTDMDGNDAAMNNHDMQLACMQYGLALHTCGVLMQIINAHACLFLPQKYSIFKSSVLSIVHYHVQ